MARPRVVTTDSGAEVTMKGLDPALADKVSALIKGKADLEVKAAVAAEAAPAVIDFSTLSSIALGSYQDPKDLIWKVAVIKFNPLTLESAFEKAIPSGRDKADASEKFRIEAANMGLV